MNKSNLGLRFLYNTILGRLLLKIMNKKFISYIYSKYMNSSLSKIKINRFIKKNNIDMNEYQNINYKSFNDFFTRKIKKGKRKISNGLIAVCDSKLMVYKIDNNTNFNIKNSIYTISELIHNESNIYEYALVFRLSTSDYHHYIYPDSGTLINTYKIDGLLHTVQPLAFKRYKVFTENSRVVTNLKCKNLGSVCYIEIGAMLIGKITNHDVSKFKIGDEKGYFEFGGSTIVVLIEKNKIKINDKILENSKNNIETTVKLGNNIGEFI